VHQFVTFAAPTPFQHAAASALAAPPRYFERFLSEYRERRDYLAQSLAECGFGVRAPEGTYFIMADIRPLGGKDGDDFCRWMVKEIGVAAIPAQAFYASSRTGADEAGAGGNGTSGTGATEGRFLIRFAFCKSMETLREGVRRLQRLSELSPERARAARSPRETIGDGSGSGRAS
jgi:N-succinyldiaminopimelate aminotransferase